MYDLLIRNTVIADGTGSPLRHADLAVQGARIAEIGKVTAAARDVIDAQGLVLAPGVIDAHTHYDAQLTWDPTASPSPALGVTSVVVGNCGFGIAPSTPETRDLILQNLSVVEGMSLDSLRAGVRWEFETFGEYLAQLRRGGVYPNVAVLASHSVMRTVVMGGAASERAATDDELTRILDLFRDAMRSGALGLGSSTLENHIGLGGVPMPSRLASDDEFRALAKVMSDFGSGLFMATCGTRTDVPFLAELSRISGRPSIYAALLHFSNQPDRGARITRQCVEARRAGLPVYAQASCQPLSMDFKLDSAYPMLTVHPWGTLPADPDGMIARMGDADFRAGIRRSLEKPEGARIFNGAWHLVEVTRAALEKNRRYDGMTIAGIAAARGVDPVDAFLDLGIEERLATNFTAKLLNVEEEPVADLLRDEGNLVSLSDGGAHLTFFCDAGFGMYFLGHWVRERGLFDLPAAVRKLTGDVADIYGLVDRGRLAVGAFADMILFDPSTVGISRARRVRDLPAGGERLTRDAPGLKTVFVNGRRVHDDGAYVKDAAAGQVLTEFSKTLPKVGMGRH
jgi:N-acyl-D-aspartate/D-glutamate deacylase